MSDEHITDTDPEPGSPHGVGESITRQGNTLAGDGGDEPAGDGDGGDRSAARSHAQRADREENRLQGSVDPQRPGPDPEG